MQELARVPGMVLPELFPVQVPYESGHLLPPESPGLGVEFNREALAAYSPIPGGRTPQLHRPDGSFATW